MKFDEQLYGITTIIEVNIDDNSFAQGSGFFYSKMGEKDPTKKAQWVEIKEIWLITNRHVAFPKINDREVIPKSLTFNLRKITKGSVEWLPITLSNGELKKRLKIHTDNEVDVAAIQIYDLIKDEFLKSKEVVTPVGLTSDHLPSKSILEINTGDDILVAGYPKGFYDMTNKYPIVKTGIIASKWGCFFNGQPLFLIDSKLFPGSSGSLVITKPQSIALIDGKIKFNKSNPFIFLGIYSSEPVYQYNPITFDGLTIIKTDSYNVGNVWYSYLVPEIIDDGIFAGE